MRKEKGTVPATIPEELRRQLAVQARTQRISLAQHAGTILAAALAPPPAGRDLRITVSGALLLAGSGLDRAEIADRLGVEAAVVDRILDTWNSHRGAVL